MTIKSDKWIREMATNYSMIKPFEPNQIRLDKSNEKIKDPSKEEKIIKDQIETKMIENMPIRKPEIKKKDK